LKSFGPWKNSHADIQGLIADCWSKLSVSSACGRRRSQRYGGKVESIPAKMGRK
jgi:hypothetical protein